jgi:hypothetical protein
MNDLPGLALNLDPPDLCHLSSQDYRHELLAPGLGKNSINELYSWSNLITFKLWLCIELIIMKAMQVQCRTFKGEEDREEYFHIHREALLDICHVDIFGWANRFSLRVMDNNDVLV